MDEKGRITLPDSIREHYGLQKGATLEIIANEGEIILRPVDRKIVKIRAERTWGEEAFLKAGTTTFEE